MGAHSHRRRAAVVATAETGTTALRISRRAADTFRWMIAWPGLSGPQRGITLRSRTGAYDRGCETPARAELARCTRGIRRRSCRHGRIAPRSGRSAPNTGRTGELETPAASRPANYYALQRKSPHLTGF